MRFGRFGAVIAIGVCASLAFSGGTQADKEKIQGTWSVVALEADDKGPPPNLKELKMVITADKMIVRTGKGDEPMKYRLDPAKKPPQIDFFGAVSKKSTGKPKLDKSPDGSQDKVEPKGDADKKGAGEEEALMLGIYRLDGDDLKIALSNPGRARPSDFMPGKNRGIITLKRDKR